LARSISRLDSTLDRCLNALSFIIFANTSLERRFGGQQDQRWLHFLPIDATLGAMIPPTFSAAGEMLATSPLQLSSPSTPYISAALSPLQRSIRLSGTELRPLDMDELEPLSPTDGQQQSRRSFEGASASTSSYPSRSAQSIDLKRAGPRSSTSSDHSSTNHVPFSARYITVSAVLSRSGTAIPLSEINRSSLNAASGKTRSRRKGSIRRQGDVANEDDLYSAASSSFVRRKTLSAEEAKRREVSNGSALEALGALLLQRDSSGKVANLSFTKSRSKKREELSRVSSAWLQGVRDAGAARLGIRMPEESDSGQTIAQRRARKQSFPFQSLFSRMSIKKTGYGSRDGDFTLVGTRYGQPTFEVGRVNGSIHEKAALGVDQVNRLPAGLNLSPPTSAATEQDNRVSSIFGVGSAFAYHDPPDVPPSPIAMPGAWTVGGPGWSSRTDDWQEEGALLLPPPLLDDQGSDAKSFEGLLGVRRMREQQRAMKELEKLKARNRPAHKIGMLTAFGNFVRAAHAADRSLKAASLSKRPANMPILHKRHTAPVYVREGQKEMQDGSVNGMGETEVMSDQYKMERSRSQGRKSLDSAVRPLDTVYEGVNTQASNTRRSSLSISSRSSLIELVTPRAPRLLPIYMTSTYPNTPFALDTEEAGLFEMDRSGDASEPPTPRLGPTLLSLPPSPWIHSSTIEDQRHSFSLQLSMQPVYGPPGAPRLAPTALEIAPSPYAMSPCATPFSKSPRISASITPAETLSPLSLSPLRSPALIAINRASNQVRARRTAKSQIADSNTRITPSTVINAEEEKVRGEPINHVNGKADQQSLHKKERIFWLWFLFGDLGLRSPASSSHAHSLRDSTVYFIYRGMVLHCYGFGIFVMAHLLDLSYHIAEFLSMTFWFVRWMVLNLTGQTVLARCLIEAYRLVQKEWQTVSLEDHEQRGVKDKGKTVRGLSRWEVVKGLIELVCLQDVTRDRYMAEGAGLDELKGWQRSKQNKTHRDRGKEWVDLGAKRQADRHAVEAEDYDQSGSSDESDTESDDDMVVTRQGPEILEFTKTPRTEPRSYFGSFSSQDDLDLAKESPRIDTKPVKESRALVKTIQWASRLAISAYGLHVTLVDLPATFTPSGNRFSRQTFAHLSRLHHEDVLHADIQTLEADAYSPTFYLVRDVARKVMVVSVRGTQSLQDIIVDLEMVVDQVELSDGEDESTEKLYCHAGVLRTAKALLSRQSTLFKTLNEALQENEGFGIVFTGHSLGGAIASTVVLLLSRYIEGDGGSWVTHESSGLPANRSIRAITFAHPASVNASLARRAGKGKIPLVLSVVLGSDIIPRCGHGQARELRRVLGGLSRVRKRKGDLFRQGKKEDEDARVHIVTSWWRWKRLKRKGKSASKEEFKKMKSIEEDLWSLRCDVENDLYAAIKTRSQTGVQQDMEGTASTISNSSSNRNIPPSPWVGPAQRAKAPLHQLASRRQALDAITLQNEESISTSGILVPAGRSILIYNKNLYQITSPLSFFSLPDFHVSLLSDGFK
jgi:hypothetical protein